MSNLFGPKASSVTPQVYTGIQVSTSMYGNAIPLMYGMTRGTMNLLIYGGFKATGNSSGGGKGGHGSQPSSYSYSAWWAGALCEGPIAGIGQVWHDRSIVTLTYENLTLYLGAGGQAAWTIPPSSQQVPYDHIAYVASSLYNFGSSASMPNLSFEIKGLLYGTGPPGPTFGGTFTGDLTASSNVIANCSPPGALAIGSILSDADGAIPSGTTVSAIGTGTVTMSQPASANGSGDTITYTVTGTTAGDADPSLIIPDYLTDPNHGAGYAGTIATLSGNNQYQGYCWSLGIGLSPTETTQRQGNDFLTEVMQITNSEIVESAGTLRVVPYADATVSGNGYSFAPNLTPIYLFGDDDYIAEEGQQPLKLTRKPLLSTYNHVIVEYLDRANFYNTAPVEAFDLDDINANGQRLAPTYTFHQVTNPNTARTVAQLLLQASLYRRNSYTCKVRADYCLLEPMDPVAITDSGLGLTAQLCWVTQVTDTGENVIELELLEVTGIANTTPQYNWSSAQGNQQNFAASPGSVVAPLFFMIPPLLSSTPGQLEMGIAVCGPSTSGNWAGCQVQVSIDGGSTYYPYGSVGPNGVPRYGTLTSNFPSGSDPDTADTLGIQFANTSDTLSAATSADADAMQSLILIDPNGASPEVVAYSAATMVGPGQYNLGTYLRRGQYQTPISAHASGAPFVRLDGAVFLLAVDPGMVGQPIYFKFLSFNSALQATQQLANVTAYSFTPTPTTLGDLALVTTGNCIAYGTDIAKAPTGVSAWDSAVYSKQGFASCSMSFRPMALPPATTNACLIGFSTTPSASNSYTNANYGILVENSSVPRLQVWEAGAAVVDAGMYAVGDLISITYDGANVRYFHNGVLVHTTPAVGLTLYLFGAFFEPGFVISNLSFNQITQQQNAVTWTTRGYAAVAGNSVQKTGTASAFDSDAWSKQSYANGCTLSAKWLQGAQAAIGIITSVPSAVPGNPGAPGGYYGWYTDSPINGLYVVANNSLIYIGSASTFASGDIFAVEYDGYYVRYYHNGVLAYTSNPVPGLTFTLYSLLYTPNATWSDIYFGSVPAATPVPFLIAGQCVVNNTTAVKQGGVNGWDSCVYSISGYNQCHIQGKPSTLPGFFMLGLATAPTAGVSYTNANYAIDQVNGTSYSIYESGILVAANVGNLTPKTTDLLAITFDGANVRYYINGVNYRTTASTAGSLFAFCPIYTPGDGINYLSFGPGVTLDSVPTTGLDQNAATVLFTGFNGTPDGFSCPVGYFRGNTSMFPGGPSYDCTAIVTITANSVQQTSGTPGTVYVTIEWDDDGSTPSYSSNYYVLPSVAGPMTLQAQFPHSHANGSNPGLHVGYTNTGSGAAYVTGSSYNVQVEYVIR